MSELLKKSTAVIVIFIVAQQKKDIDLLVLHQITLLTQCNIDSYVE